MLEQVVKELTTIKDALNNHVAELNERVRNLEEALASRIAVRRVPVMETDPLRRWHEFLFTHWDDPELQKMQDVADAYTIYYHICKAKRIQPKGALVEKFNEVVKTVTSATLPDYVPIAFSSRLLQLIRLQPSVHRIFEVLDMPSERFRPPVAISGLQVSGVAAGGTVPLADPVAEQVELVAKKIAGGVAIAEEFTEDSIVAIVPALLNEFAYAFADALDKVIIKGDTSSNDPLLKLWDGLIKKANTTTNTEWSAQAVADALAAFDVVDPKTLALIVHPTDYAAMLKWPEVLTVDKYGPAATVLSGELGKIYGVPILVSPYVTKVVAGETKRVPLIVQHRWFVLGIRRGVQVETDRDVQTLRDILVASMRCDFASFAPSGKVIVKEVAVL